MSQEKKQKRSKEMEITNVSSTLEKENVTKGWREGTEGPLQIPSTQWGQKLKRLKLRLTICFKLVHKIGSHPVLLYNSSFIFKVCPKHNRDGTQ